MEPLQPLLISRTELFAAGAPVYVNTPLHEGDTPLHQHDFIEIALVVDGRAVHRTIHGLAPISRGDVFVIQPGQWHAYERCRELRLHNCGFGTDLLHRQLAWVHSDPALATVLSEDRGQGIRHFHLKEAATAHCAAHLAALHAIQLGANPLRAAADQLGHLLLLLGELGRQVQPQRSAEHLGNPAVSEAIKLMEARLHHDWSLDELAQRLELNRSYLVRLFRRRTGFTPINWLARRRAEVAAVRLLTSDDPIAAIGKSVGWTDQNYFARRFRGIFGQTPSAYRKQLPRPAVHHHPDDWIQW